MKTAINEPSFEARKAVCESNEASSSRVGPTCCGSRPSDRFIREQTQPDNRSSPPRRTSRIPGRKTFIVLLLLVGLLLWAMLHGGCAGTTTKFSAPTAESKSESKQTPGSTSIDETVVIKIKPSKPSAK